MGYTHYWFNRESTIDNYETLCADVDQARRQTQSFRAGKDRRILS